MPADFEDNYEDITEDYVDLEETLNDVDAAAAFGDDDDDPLGAAEELPDEDAPAARPVGQPRPGGSRERRTVTRAVAADEAGEDEQAPVEEPTAQAQQARTDAEWNRMAYQQRQMERRFDMLVSALQQAAVQQNQPPPQPEAEAPDPDEDLPGYLVHGIDKLTREREQDKQLQQQREAQQAAQHEFVAARNTALAFRESNPVVYDAAVDHLTRTSYEELAEEYPQANEQQIAVMLAQQAQARMTTWYRQGKNVGEELYKLARRRGFAPQAPQSPANGNGKPRTSDARQEVQAQKTREQKGRTITQLAGKSAASKVSARKLLSLSEDDYEVEVARLAKGAGGRVSLRDLLKGKERVGS